MHIIILFRSTLELRFKWPTLKCLLYFEKEFLKFKTSVYWFFVKTKNYLFSNLITWAGLMSTQPKLFFCLDYIKKLFIGFAFPLGSVNLVPPTLQIVFFFAQIIIFVVSLVSMLGVLEKILHLCSVVVGDNILVTDFYRILKVAVVYLFFFDFLVGITYRSQ